MAEEKPAEKAAAKPEDQPAAKPEGGSVDTSSALGLLKSATSAALPVVVSAIVSVGFVAFAGKAILWTRFQALQVPGDQVVRAVPQDEAVAIGASLLLIFGALGVLAATGVYLLDRAGRATARMSRGLLVILGAEAVVAIWHTAGKPLTSSIIATEFVVLAVATIFWSTFVAGLTQERKAPGGEGDEGERNPPHGPFYRVETDPDEAPKKPEGKLPRKATSGVSRRAKIVTSLAAAGAGVAAFAIAYLIGGVGWGGVAALAAVGLALGGAVLWHCIAFWLAEKKKEEQVRQEAHARAAREKEEARKKAKEKAEKEARKRKKKAKRKKKRKARRKKRKRRKHLEKLRACLIAQWKALGCGWRAAPTIVLVSEPPPEPKPEKPKGGKGKKPPEPKPSGVDFAPLGMALVLVLTALLVAVPWILLGEWWLAVTLGVVAVLGWALWQIASLSKERFVWYGLAVFISVPLFGTAMLMSSNADEPEVQPMALIRETDGPEEAIQGLYVTEGDERVYFASVATEGCTDKVRSNSGRLLWVPKEEVVAMSVGPLQGVTDASKAALEMSYDLTPAVETGGAIVNLAGREKDVPGGAPEEATEASEGAAEASGGDSDDATEEGSGTTEGSDEATDEDAGTMEAGEEEESQDEGGGEEGSGAGARLENVGPAVRPNFGAGLRIEPEIVSPGGEATLWASAPNLEVEGFGPSRAGHNLRLGGRVVDIAKEKSGAARAEYIETESGRLIDLDKQGAYLRQTDGEFALAEDADDDDGTGPYVRLADPAILEVDEEPIGEEPVYVRIDESADGVATVAKGGSDGEQIAGKVTLAGGTFEGRSWDAEANVRLAGLPLLRQSWHEDHIKFHVPEDATSGVVTVECDQLAGAPLLQVSHVPHARIAVQMKKGTPTVTFDSTASRGESSASGGPSSSGAVRSDAASAKTSGGTTAKGAASEEEEEEEEEPLKRRWKVDGVQEGHSDRIELWMPPRMAPYAIELTITDEEGNVDTANLQLLRLPAVALKAGAKDNEKVQQALDATRKAIEEAVEAERPTGVQLDAFTDSPGKAARNLARSLKRDARVRKRLLRDSPDFSDSDRAVPVEELAHGETCPLHPKASPANLHVDLLLLHEGVIVKPAKECRALAQKSDTWQPPPGKAAD